jgi:hypothetical protein
MTKHKNNKLANHQKREPRVSTAIRKKAMIEAMQNSLGNITYSTRSIGVSRASHYGWMRTDENYKKQIEECKEIALDFVEAALMKLISKGKTSAIIYFLKHRGRSRGYNIGCHGCKYLEQANQKNEFEKMSIEELELLLEEERQR